MTRDPDYSGDVTLTGTEETPVELRDPADTYLRPDSVSGDLELRNPEYVFTHQQLGGGVEIGEPGTRIRGDLEDGYADPEGVTGDAVIADAEDAFVPAGAVDGTLSVVGAENVYGDEGAPERDPDEWDATTAGWEQSASVTDPDVGVKLTGARHEVTVEKTRRDVEVYVVGHHHEVEITGRRATVTLFLLGYENMISVGPYLDAEVGTDTGFDNSVEEDPYPVEDLIEMEKDEAFGTAGFGRHKVTYQMPATDEEWCPNCGEPADAIIERHQMEAWFVFGHPLKVYDRSTNPAGECEHCSPNAMDAELSERERKNILK